MHCSEAMWLIPLLLCHGKLRQGISLSLIQPNVGEQKGHNLKATVPFSHFVLYSPWTQLTISTARCFAADGSLTG